MNTVIRGELECVATADCSAGLLRSVLLRSAEKAKKILKWKRQGFSGPTWLTAVKLHDDIAVVGSVGAGEGPLEGRL